MSSPNFKGQSFSISGANSLDEYSMPDSFITTIYFKGSGVSAVSLSYGEIKNLDISNVRTLDDLITSAKKTNRGLVMKLSKQLVKELYGVPSDYLEQVDNYVENHEKPNKLIIHCLAGDLSKVKDDKENNFCSILEGLTKYITHTVPREIMGDYDSVYKHLGG